MRPPIVETIDLKNRLMWLEDGRCLPITVLFDVLDEECCSEAEAVKFVGGADGVGWFGGLVSEFARPTLH